MRGLLSIYSPESTHILSVNSGTCFTVVTQSANISSSETETVVRRTLLVWKSNHRSQCPPIKIGVIFRLTAIYNNAEFLKLSQISRPYSKRNLVRTWMILGRYGRVDFVPSNYIRLSWLRKQTSCQFRHCRVKCHRHSD